MDNNYSNVMDGSRITEQNMLTCRLCSKQFMYYSDFAFHERMHFEQMSLSSSLQGGLRPAYDNHAGPPAYSSGSSTSATLDSFDKLIQPFRSTMPETDHRSLSDSRNIAPSSQPDLRNYLPSSPADARNMAVASSADPRNMVVTSPADTRNMVPSSPADPRNLIPSSPADTRNLVPSSPADPRNILPVSPVDPRNLVPASPVDHRNLVPASPVDPRNLVPASPVDPRNLVPASPVDPRNMVPASPVDPRNMVPASPVDPRNMVPASTVDPRNLVPASPVDPRNLVPASTVDPRNLVPASPVDHRNLVPASPVDPRNMASPAAQPDPRNLMVSSPASQLDKSAQLYRGEMESPSMNVGALSTSINTQSSTVSMATVPMATDARLLSGDTRSVQSQVTDSRHLPVDSLTYSTASFLDSLTRSLYSPDLANKPMSSVPFTAHPMGQPEEILGLDSRQHSIQKPDPYYGLPKSHYHHTPGVDVGDSYAGNQYGLSKLLGTQQGSYYQQGVPSQPQTHYGIDKLTAAPLNYYNQPNDKSSNEQRDTLPKQTLHYGPPASNHSHYQSSIPHTDELHSNPSHQKVPKCTEQLRATFQPASPHLAYGPVYKGTQPQTQVYVPVPSHALPSHALPSQHDYKLSTEPIPTVNLEPKQHPQEITCYICQSPFSNMAEMSEHLKIHAQGMVAQNRTPVSPRPSQQNFQPSHMSSPTIEHSEILPTCTTEPHVSPGFASVNPATAKETLSVKAKDIVPEKAKDTIPVNCDVCGKVFVKQIILIEHMKIHTTHQQYECKVCGKMFKKKCKCLRHEALHSRDIHMYYCEICDMNFEQTGKYLQHIQTLHTEQDSIRSNLHKEHQTGTKKAVPLTGGSIDTTFDGMDTGKCIDCQICDEEIEKTNLVAHLNTHDVHTCDKCDNVFLHKTEYVEHLMSQHRKELADAKSDDEHDTPKSKSPTKIEDKNTEPSVKVEVKHKVSGMEGKINKSRKDVIKDLKEKKKEVMKNLKEKQKEIRDLEYQKKMKEKKVKGDVNTLIDNNKDVEDVKKIKSEIDVKFGITEMKLKFSCSRCKMSFAKKSDLILHVETHVKDPTRIYCEVCDYSYHAKEKGYYIYHMKYHRDHELIESDQPTQLPCNICYKNIAKENFVTHVKRAHSKYSCDLCQWSYSSDKSLVKHMRSIHGGKKYKYYVYRDSHYIEDIVEPAPTPEPPVLYKKLKDIKVEDQIVEKTPAKVFECRECKRTFTKKQNRDRHFRTHNVFPADELQIVCELCQVHVGSRGTYLYHLQHHAEFETNTSVNIKSENSEDDGEIKSNAPCNDNKNARNAEFTETKKEVQNEKENESIMRKERREDSTELPIKSEFETEKPAVKQTLITVLNPETGDFEEKLIEEKDEPEIVIDIKIFEEDFDNKEDDETVKTEEKGVTDVVSEIVYCRLCNKCVKRSTLSEHTRTHSTFSCHACHYSFTKRQRYVDHQKTLHLDEFIAEEIEKFKLVEKCASEELLQNDSNVGKKEKDSHRRKRSTKILNCPLCTSELRQDKYVDHIRSHAKLILSCHFCERSFSKRNIVVMHERSHQLISHGINELPYPKLCPVCENGMKSREDYMNHIIEHSKKALVKCKKCEAVFTSDRNLDNHSRIYHDPNMTIYWKQDGEGLKFDPKTGRIHEVISDYLCEIKELNELCKQFGKPAIWLTTTPRKSKEKSAFVDKSKEATKNDTEVSESAETSESDEKVKVESSDEDYIPMRELRKRKSGKIMDSDEEDEYNCEEEEYEYRPSKKRRHSHRYTSDDSVSEDLYKSKCTRTRQVVVKKDLLLKKKIKQLKRTAGRVLRSALESRHEKEPEKVNSNRSTLKRKGEDLGKASSSPKKRRSEVDNLSFEEVKKARDTEEFPDKCPICGTAQFSLNSYNEHARVHTGGMPFECPVCDQRFARKVNMLTHVKYKHKDYKPKDLKKREKQLPVVSNMIRRLRIRSNSPNSKPGTPISSSTPIKGSKLVVRLSPIDVEQRKKVVKSTASKNKEATGKSSDATHILLDTIEKKDIYNCDICKKKFTQRWNYAQHVQGHGKEGKKKDKEVRTVANKKDMKKKEKESKPFSCRDCSESFKKKRDLYIHTKMHSTDEDESVLDVSDRTELDNLTNSVNTSVQSETADKWADNSLDATGNFADKNCKMNENKSESNNSSLNDSLEMSTDLNLGDSFNIDPDTNRLVKKNKKQGTKEKNGAKNGTKDESGIKSLSKMNNTSVSEFDVDTMPGGKGELAKGEKSVKTRPAATESNKESELSKTNNGCETSVAQNNNDDHSKGGDSDSEKTKQLRSQPSVNKMSTETAVSKWKARVTELLSSQLELHAAKKQEELANPEIKRVKEYLSISGRGEKHKFECRICGDSTCDQESTFRHHMDVHLKEPPPHCNICDIYFMAIHPKRRLAEHNKKKHPELNF